MGRTQQSQWQPPSAPRPSTQPRQPSRQVPDLAAWTRRAQRALGRSRAMVALAACCLLVVGSVVGMAAPSLGDSGTPDPVAQLLAPVLNILSPPPPPAPPAPPAPPPAPPTDAPASTLVADAVQSSVTAYTSPGGSVLAHIDGVNAVGQPEAFVVTGQSPGWDLVELPIKPNGTTGWIESSSVTTRSDPYYIRVHQGQFSLDLYHNGYLDQQFTVAVGTPSTPTPNGSFFVWASQAWNRAPYAVGIFALSAFSPVLVNWPGGGRTGIHGWRDTSVMGTRASNGCVRMTGPDFQYLLNNVTLGTPVEILP